MKLPKCKPTPEEKGEIRDRMSALIEFFEINDLTPGETVPMTMRFIACTCKGKIELNELVSMFRMMVKAVNRGEE